MKVAIAVIGFLITSAFASVPDVQACGGWWDPCCPWYQDQSTWDASCFPQEEQQPEPEPEPQPVVEPQPEPETCGGWWNPCCPWWEPNKCSQVQQIVHRGVSQADKDQYTKDAEKMKRAIQFFAALTATALTFEKDEVRDVVVTLASAAAALARWAQFYFEGLANDPWDDNYAYPYDAPLPSAEELELAYCSENSTAGVYCNVLVEATRWTIRQGDGAYTSLNRAGTCEQVEGSNCAQQRADEAYDYIVALGQPVQDAGYAMSILRDLILEDGGSEDVYSPECDCWLADILGQTAQDLWDAGQYLATR
jgi:hypothetical protein